MEDKSVSKMEVKIVVATIVINKVATKYKIRWLVSIVVIVLSDMGLRKVWSQ